MRIELPQTCWEVNWCLGWNIKDWNIDEITYATKTRDIIKEKLKLEFGTEVMAE